MIIPYKACHTHHYSHLLLRMCGLDIPLNMQFWLPQAFDILLPSSFRHHSISLLHVFWDVHSLLCLSSRPPVQTAARTLHLPVIHSVHGSMLHSGQWSAVCILLMHSVLPRLLLSLHWSLVCTLPVLTCSGLFPLPDLLRHLLLILSADFLNLHILPDVLSHVPVFSAVLDILRLTVEDIHSPK